MHFVNLGGHIVIFRNELRNFFVLGKISRLLLNFKRSTFLVNAIKIRRGGRIKNATAFDYVEIKRPIAAEFHFKTQLRKNFSFAEKDAADIRNNIFNRKTFRDKFCGTHREIFCPIEVKQIGKVLFGRENRLPVLNKFRATKSNLNRIICEDGREIR